MIKIRHATFLAESFKLKRLTREMFYEAAYLFFDYDH